MLLTLSQIMLAVLPSRVLNILISPGGDGDLLSQVAGVLPTTIHMEPTFSSFALIFSQIFITTLVRYVLGHAVATMLILEIGQKDRAFSDHGRTNKRSLTFRSIYKAMRLIYDTQSLSAFLYAILIAAVYQVTHLAIRICLEITIFGHELLIPFAYACSSVLLCKLHLMWTCATISSHRPRLSSLAEAAQQSKWTHLAIPSFTYGICQALMSECQGLLQASMIPSNEMPISSSRRASVEILAAIIMLAFRFLGLMPTSIALILTEASLLPGKLETIIPSPTKQRGSTIAELLGGEKVPMGLAAFSSALKGFGVAQFLWLIELHLKKCFVQIVFEVLTLPIVLLGIL